ncbi:hypothetical protein KC19_10G122500 [Ceratodon purpureus]|uniref:Uncharacterized protein n=1 Tax=Ceratodon purpureus TaxID=3225 RepID=A0A8T0GMB8_CERPU|nr:hypothetical protein KC19_10G122500 [Ceratodon purpureus]
MAALRSRSGCVSLLLTVLFLTTTSFVGANFHVMNVHEFNGGQAIYLVPSNNFGCNGVQSTPIARTQYPDCSAGYLHVPDTQCGWSGVTIKPACSGNYFGKLYGNSGEEQGDCYWNDSRDTFSFTCNNGQVYDRLVCYTSMCGNQLSDTDVV